MITHKGSLTTEEFMAWLKDGKDMLLAKMGDYCKVRGSTLSEWLEWYLGDQKAEAGPSAVTGQTM